MSAGIRPLALIAFGTVAMACPTRLAAQSTIPWANIGPNWENPANWVGGVVPGFPDSAFFIPNVLTPGVNPFIAASTIPQVQNLAIGNAPLLGNYRFLAGPSAGLEISANVAGGTLSTRGIGETVFDGPFVRGVDMFRLGVFNVGTSTTLTFQNASAIIGNQGNITLNGGTLRLDNSAVNVPARIQATNTLTITGSGMLDFIGNSAGTTTNAPILSAGSNSVGGVNVIRVTPSGSAATLNFANSGSFGLRPGTRATYHFVAATGNLGDAGGARITFTGSPFLGANGLLANTAGGGTVGWAIVTDAGGTDFATWNATSGIVRAVPTQTGTTAANLQSYTASDRVQYNQAAATETATANITNGSLRITPPSAGQTLAMGGFNLATNALMLTGAENFTITANTTSTFGSTGTRYIYVNNPETTLTVNGLQVANGGNPSFFAGPGFVDLTSNASQNTLTTTNRFVIGGGTVRGNNTQIGFTSAGAGIISLVGGVLEIKNGTNGTGAAADFTRPLGAAAGNVAWGAGTANEQGSGGFSAFGSAASVNIGGATTPASLQWGQANFIADGFALLFGSTKSNARLNFLNPLQLDNGATYQAREIRVIGGVGGDAAVMAGGINGAANADLIKTGGGTLLLPTGVTNSYQGTTFVAEGTLQVDGVLAAAPNPVIVGRQGTGSSGTLSGIGQIHRNVLVQPTGTLKPGSSPGVLTINGGLTMTLGSKADFQIQSGTTPGNGAGFHSQLVVNGGAVNLGNATLNLDFTGATYTPALTDRIVLIDYSSGPGTLTGTFNGLPDDSIAVSNVLGSGLDYYIYYGTLAGYANKVVLSPVPEPVHILLVCGVGAAGYGWFRRRATRRPVPPTS